MAGKIFYKVKYCACGCGRVGRFHTYATSACRQRAYRNRGKERINQHAYNVSEWLIEQFSAEDCEPIFEALNCVRGMQNVKLVNSALEKIVYLVESKVRKERSKARRITK